MAIRMKTVRRLSQVAMVYLISSMLCALVSAQEVEIPRPDLPVGYDYKKSLSAKDLIDVKAQMLDKEIDLLETWIRNAKKTLRDPRSSPEQKESAQRRIQNYEAALAPRKKDANDLANAGVAQKKKLQIAKANFARWRAKTRSEIRDKEAEIKRIKDIIGNGNQRKIKQLEKEVEELQTEERALINMEHTAEALINP